MNYKDAINASQNWGARGFNSDGVAIVSVAHYGGKLVWITGWEGDWKKKWVPIPEDELFKLDRISFLPMGPKDDDLISVEMMSALEEIADEYEHEEEEKSNYFEPMGETYE